MSRRVQTSNYTALIYDSPIRYTNRSGRLLYEERYKKRQSIERKAPRARGMNPYIYIHARAYSLYVLAFHTKIDSCARVFTRTYAYTFFFYLH